MEKLPKTNENIEKRGSNKLRRLFQGVALSAGLVGGGMIQGCNLEDKRDKEQAEAVIDLGLDVFATMEGVEISKEDRVSFKEANMSLISFEVDALDSHLENARDEAKSISHPYLKARVWVDIAKQSKNPTDYSEAMSALGVLSPGQQMVLSSELEAPHK